MRVRIDVRELVLHGLPRGEGRAFAHHLEDEVSRLVSADAVPSPRAVDEVRVELTGPATSGTEAAAEVARAVSRELGV